MKSIVVKNENSVACYTSGCKHQQNDKGEWEEIKETDEQMEQSCYQSLIRDVKQNEFEKYLISVLSNYDERMMKDWTNIQIKLSYSTQRHCEMNIGNDKNIQWQKMELPETEGQ